MQFLHWPAMADLQGVPNLSMKHLRAVVTLASFGSFIAAASYLRVSQPGLSRIIQQAEGRLGVKLFVRGTRSVSQTEAGREFIPAAERDRHVLAVYVAGFIQSLAKRGCVGNIPLRRCAIEESGRSE